MRKARITGGLYPSDPTPFARGLNDLPGAGKTLADQRATFGGDRGLVDDPLGEWHEISLEPFAEQDPGQFFLLSFVFPPEGVAFPDLTPGEVVLKEYELPEGTVLPWESQG